MLSQWRIFTLVEYSCCEGDEGVVAPWCNSLMTLEPEQSGRVGLNPGRAPPFECHDWFADSIRSTLFLQSQRLVLKNATSPSPSC